MATSTFGTVIDRPLASDLDDTTALDGLPGRFCLHYQPLLDLRTGAIETCEALLRWNHPDFGLLHPHASLAGTRWCDDLDALEEWALMEVCRQGARWNHHGLDIQVALNVTTTFLGSEAFLPSIEHALTRSGMSPRNLAIDVPFAALAVDPLRVEHVARKLNSLDVAVIIDGVVGDAHPVSLDHIEASAWKIDVRGQGHERSTQHRSVGRALDHAHEVGAMAIAKAVEDEQDLAAVRVLGFDAAFGDVLSPAVDARSARTIFRPVPPTRPPLFGSLPDAGQAVRNR